MPIVEKSIVLYRQCSADRRVERSEEVEAEHCRYGDLDKAYRESMGIEGFWCVAETRERHYLRCEWGALGVLHGRSGAD